MKYYNVFGESGYDSAFLTTYAFSAQSFEDIPLPRLRGSGCRNILVLADQNMLNTSFVEFGPPRYAGTSYHVGKVAMPGAFHPKITLLSGASKGRLLIGSANLTGLGLGGNRELVANIPYSSDEPENLPLFGQAIRYIHRYVPTDDPWFPSAFDRAFRHAPWLRRAYSEETNGERDDLKLLLDQSENTVLDQITAAIGGDRIERLVVLSPYWDKRLEGLRRLRTAMHSPPTDLLLEPKADPFPVESLAHQENVQLFDATQLFKVATDASPRFIHAKLFLAQGEKWDHVISGSMNCSRQALMGYSTPRGNAEGGIYKRVPCGEALAALGLEGYENHPLEVESLPQRQEKETAASTQPAIIDAGSFELHGKTLFWKPTVHETFNPAEIRLLDRDGKEPPQILQIADGNRLQWDVKTKPRPKTALVVGHNGIQSVPHPIVDFNVLENSTRPVRRGQKRMTIDNLGEWDWEKLDFFEDFRELLALEIAEQGNSSLGGKLGSKKPSPHTDEQTTYDTLPYEAFVEARNRAWKQGEERRSPRMGGKRETLASAFNACLNRLIEPLFEEPWKEEEQALQKDASVDLRTTEPSDSEEETNLDEEFRKEISDGVKKKTHAILVVKNFREAIEAFENRARSFKDTPITVTELVWLRRLLQVTLVSAMPISSAPREHQVLPLKSKESMEWPRLIGRLLLQYFVAIRALQPRNIEEYESEYWCVLDCLAVAHFSAKAAVKGAVASPSLDEKAKNGLATIQEKIETHFQEAMTKGNAADQARLENLGTKLHERFAHLIGLDE